MVFDSQCWFQASSQYADVSAARTMQNAIASSIEATASQKRGRGARCSGKRSTLTCPRSISTYGQPMNVAATRLYVTKSVCQIVFSFKTNRTNTISQTTQTPD